MTRNILENRRRLVIALGALPLARLAGATDLELQRTGGPFVPTPQVVVDEMLRMAKVRAEAMALETRAAVYGREPPAVRMPGAE